MIDRELARKPQLPIGAYFTAICTKSAVARDRSNSKPFGRRRWEERLVKLLSCEGVEFDIREHERVRNLGDVTRVLGLSSEEMAKAIIVMGKKEGGPKESFYVFVVSGNFSISLGKIGAVLGKEVREWRLATQTEIREQFGLEVGAVPPFGYEASVRVFFDTRLLDLDWVYCGVGSPYKSLHIRVQDLQHLASAIPVDIAATSKISSEG